MTKKVTEQVGSTKSDIVSLVSNTLETFMLGDELDCDPVAATTI